MSTYRSEIFEKVSVQVGCLLSHPITSPFPLEALNPYLGRSGAAQREAARGRPPRSDLVGGAPRPTRSCTQI